MLTLSSTTPCPESISVTIVSASPTAPCTEVGPNAEVTSLPTVPLSVFTSTTELSTSPSSTTTTAPFPVKPDTSPPMLGTNPSNKTAAPSSINIGRIPINTVFPSTQRPNSGTWINANFVNTRLVPGFITVPRIVKRRRRSSSSMMTTRKLTPQSLPITRVPRILVDSKTLSTHTSRRTTLTTTQMTTESRLMNSPGACDNGGTWMQGRCFCPRTFYGARCKLAAREIHLDMVDSEVGMAVSVNQEFSPDLSDNSSQVYRDFTKAFRDQIKKIYQNVQGFKEVQILSLRNGSIVVEYLVLLELPFSLQLEEEYEKVKVALKEELQNVSQDGNSCQNDQVLCLKPDSIKVNNTTRTELSPEAICRRAAAEGFEDFYFPFLEENQLRCVTKCTSGVEGAIDCHQGQCVLQRSGPACRCFSTDTHWFLGPRCEVAISWKALVGGLAGVGALLLLLLVVALSVFVVRSRRRDRQGRGRSRDDRKWFETWDQSAKPGFSNFAFQDDRRGAYSQT
ncbi:mucin-3B-like [Moschus berezovskii]|uniref:mucin-3B-like n=1 Tax=Moschus berezovskii TaxID=68408 RepID=UPI00244454DB|nr:mucin-3B-like [Moschus berezovskii]